MIRRPKGHRGGGGIVLTVVVVALLGSACAGGNDEAGSMDLESAGGSDEIAQAGPQRAAGVGEQSESDSESDYGVEAMAMGGTAIPSIGASVIKTADLRLEAPRGDFSQAVQAVENAAPRYGGFVLSTSLEDTSKNRGTIVIRVPSEDFESALRDVKDAGELLGENIAGKDVSQEFIDLEARINNLQAQEAVFLSLMDRATNITQTIRIQNELSGLQLGIEQLQGRLNFLRDRTALGTISVSLVEAGTPAPGEQNTFEAAWARAVDLLEGLGAALIFLMVAIVFPLLLLGLIGLVIFRQLKPRLTS